MIGYVKAFVRFGIRGPKGKLALLYDHTNEFRPVVPPLPRLAHTFGLVSLGQNLPIYAKPLQPPSPAENAPAGPFALMVYERKAQEAEKKRTRSKAEKKCGSPGLASRRARVLVEAQALFQACGDDAGVRKAKGYCTVRY